MARKGRSPQLQNRCAPWWHYAEVFNPAIACRSIVSYNTAMLLARSALVIGFLISN